jgi:ATP-dependent exoDNAse (exonuclease V) beta subunit
MLAELGVEQHELDAAATAVSGALGNAIGHERGRWLLFGDHSLAGCELLINTLRDGRIERYIVDRSFVTANGERWVIDYKTSSHSGGDLQAFIASEVERYTPQLTGYAQAFAALEPERRVRAALYFPLLDVFEEIPSDAQ